MARNRQLAEVCQFCGKSPTPCDADAHPTTTPEPCIFSVFRCRPPPCRQPAVSRLPPATRSLRPCSPCPSPCSSSPALRLTPTRTAFSAVFFLCFHQNESFAHKLLNFVVFKGLQFYIIYAIINRNYYNCLTIFPSGRTGCRRFRNF